MTETASTFQATVSLVAASIALRFRPTDGELDREYQARQHHLARLGSHTPADELERLLRLSASEMAVIWLLAAIATSRDARDAAALATQATGPEYSIEQLQTLLCGATYDARAFSDFAPSGSLRRLSLIEKTNGEETHDARQTWTLSRRTLSFLHGSRTLDASLSPLAEVVELSERENSVSATDGVVKGVRSAIATGALLIASGTPGNGRRSVVRTAALSEGLRLLEIDADLLSRQAAERSKQLRLLARECNLLGCAPLLRNVDTLESKELSEAISSSFAQEIVGPIFVTCGQNRPPMRWGKPTIVVDVKPPTGIQRASLWLSALGQGTQDDAEYLATQYPLAPALIHHAAKAAKARANGRKMDPEDIYAGVRAVLDDKLGDHAKRVEVTQTWDDLVVPEDQMEAVQYLIARIRQRRTVYEQWGFAAKVGKGLGTSALFSGPPGTGKTMVAALIAKELGLELYQVDMAKVVSKFIGETERNLSALFDAAEAGHAVLLFDEADSLFGKRTEVKSSNDRYANLETNYLLQRLESFTGICLLTSNHESNIDPAFQRRLSLHLRFELPEAEERAALWQAMLPAAAPVADDVDFDSLGRRFVMSGGYIRNAALRAAFLAADEGSVITGPHLERAARLEYEGMGKIAA